MSKFDHVIQVIEQKDQIQELLKNAITVAASGRKVEKSETVMERPDILIEILSDDAVLKKAFELILSFDDVISLGYRESVQMS